MTGMGTLGLIGAAFALMYSKKKKRTEIQCSFFLICCHTSVIRAPHMTTSESLDLNLTYVLANSQYLYSHKSM